MEELTGSDIITLAEEYKSYYRWKAAYDYAAAYYGDNASLLKCKLTVETTDWHPYINHPQEIVYVYVYDSQGNEIIPNLTLPAWKNLVSATTQQDNLLITQLMAEANKFLKNNLDFNQLQKQYETEMQIFRSGNDLEDDFDAVQYNKYVLELFCCRRGTALI